MPKIMERRRPRLPMMAEPEIDEQCGRIYLAKTEEEERPHSMRAFS